MFGSGPHRLRFRYSFADRLAHSGGDAFYDSAISLACLGTLDRSRRRRSGDDFRKTARGAVHDLPAKTNCPLKNPLHVASTFNLRSAAAAWSFEARFFWRRFRRVAAGERGRMGAERLSHSTIRDKFGRAKRHGHLVCGGRDGEQLPGADLGRDERRLRHGERSFDVHGRDASATGDLHGVSHVYAFGAGPAHGRGGAARQWRQGGGHGLHLGRGQGRAGRAGAGQ